MMKYSDHTIVVNRGGASVANLCWMLLINAGKKMLAILASLDNEYRGKRATPYQCKKALDCWLFNLDDCRNKPIPVGLFDEVVQLVMDVEIAKNTVWDQPAIDFLHCRDVHRSTVERYAAKHGHVVVDAINVIDGKANYDVMTRESMRGFLDGIVPYARITFAQLRNSGYTRDPLMIIISLN